MKNVTNNFKNDIKTYGRQFKFEIKINNIDISEDDMNYIKPSFNSKLFKTVMHQNKIDSKDKLDLKSKINVRVGVKVNEPDYEYVSYNTYIVNSCERQEDTNSYISLAYDKMVESMIDYDLEILQKIKLREYLIRVCQRLGWNTKNIPATFINSEQLVDPTLHIGIGYTFRDVLDEIATLSCSCLLFKEEEFYLIYPTETNQNIDDSYLNEDDITIGEKYFINSLVFSRAEESDNIYRKDDKSIEENGLHEYRISDNQLLSTNDRDLYIDEIFNYLKSFEFYTFDVKSKGILFLEAYDRFNFVFNGNTYSTLLLNNEVSFDDGLEEYLYLDAPEETETEYKYADTTDKRINQTHILVDKQNQIIKNLVSSQSQYEDKLTTIEQTVDSINQNVGSIVNYKRNIEGVTQIHLTESGEQDILKLEVIGNKTYEDNLYPQVDLFPSEIYPNEVV